MHSLILVHFIPTWVVGGLILRYLHLKPFPREPFPLRQLVRGVVFTIGFVPVMLGGSWLSIPVPMPSFLGDTVIHGQSVTEALGRLVTPLFVGTGLAWLVLMAGAGFRKR